MTHDSAPTEHPPKKHVLSFNTGRYGLFFVIFVKFLTTLCSQTNASQFPIVSHMAIDYLPIQGSSVPCEHVFSDAGLTDEKLHAWILPGNFDTIQTVKGKYKKEWK